VSTSTLTGAARAIEAILQELEEAGIAATHDAGAFYPQPVGVLVGLPALTGVGLASASYTVPVLVVSGDPLNSIEAVDRLYALADDVAFTLSAAEYRPSSFQGGPNAEPLPAVEVAAVVTATYLGNGGATHGPD
jgi:hypothetical protein